MSQKHLQPIDYVMRWVLMFEHQPAAGHFINVVACRKPRPSGPKDDSTSRCSMCDAHDLLKAHGIEVG